MDSKVVATCFVDLKDSTRLTGCLGHPGIRNIREELFKVSRQLCELAGGKYIKNTGDGCLLVFDEAEPSLRFSAQLQQYYDNCYCKEGILPEVRIGLSWDAVEWSTKKDDVFGHGVNLAARLENAASVKEVWVNKKLVDMMQTVWKSGKAVEYFENKGKQPFKGIDDSDSEAFSFDWRKYINNNSDNSLAKLVYNHLEEATITPSNLSVEDLANPSFVIWPVVPRDIVNAIHRGQIEMIRLLIMLDWKVHILIADCGITESYTREYADEFRRLVEEYAQKRRIINLDSSFMSELYCPGQNDCRKIHRYFQSVISDLTLRDLLGIIQKGYKEDIEPEVKEKPTLDFLRPALTIAAVLRISEKLGGRCIVVVGYDEEIQWTRAHDIPGSRAKVGVLFNPVLKDKEGYQNRQTKNWPYWDSWQAMLRDMERTNLALWTTKMHAFIPAFPAKCIKIGKQDVCKESFEDIENTLDKEALAKHVFNNILNI